MAANPQFVGQILESSAAGYAGLAASLLLEQHPDVEQRYGPRALTDWKSQQQQWLLELASAIDSGHASLFATSVRWTREAFLAREVPEADMTAGLQALRETLNERLPPDAATVALRFVDHALESLKAKAAAAPSMIDVSTTSGKLALRYLEALLEGRSRSAVKLITAAVDDGLPVREVYLDVLSPVLREVGRMWHAMELTIAEEHLITVVTRRLMSILSERVIPENDLHKTVVAACVAGNMHDIGPQMVTDFFDMQGWRAIFLGPDVPQEEIVRAAQYFKADLVLVSATLTTHLRSVRGTVAALRAVEDREFKILVGGQAFAGEPELWKGTGADGYPRTIEEAVELGRKLVGLEP